MALAVIQHVLFDNYPAATGILQGMALAVRSVNGKATVYPANRVSTLSDVFIGIAGDDSTNSGNTQAIVDPVNPGNYSHDTSNAGDDPYDFSGPDFQARPARRLGDYLIETIANVTNWTDVDSNGQSTPKRGMTVWMVGGRYRTDQYVDTMSTSGAAADAGAAPTWAPDDQLTFGVTDATYSNAGLFIKVTTPTTDGVTIARVLDSDEAGDLLDIRVV